MGRQTETDWAAIIYRGIESETLDYKAAQNWRELNRREKGKFVRHCLAMANTKGGHVVVGVGEDAAGKPSLYTGLTDEQLKSFDPSDVGGFINRRADPPIDFEVVRPTVDGKRYAILAIKRFTQLPHVASGQVEDELQIGCFYIRTADATSRVAYRAAEIHDLVQRALRNQREILGRMIRGLLYEKGLSPEPIAESLFAEELRHAKAFLSRNARGAFADTTLELQSAPDRYNKRAFGLSEVRGAVLAAHRPFSDAPLFPADGEQTYFTNVSLRCLALDDAVYFQAFRSGQFHLQRALGSGAALDVDALIALLTGSLYFLSGYYEALGVSDMLITTTLRLNGVDGKRVHVSGLRGGSKGFVCRIPEIRIELKRSAADLQAGIVDHAARVFQDIFLRFNVPESRLVPLKKQIADFLERRGLTLTERTPPPASAARR